MRASRLVNLLLLLQARGGLTAAELASELEVSVRTIHRDVEELSAAGVPIFAERGPHGGIRLVDGYRTRLTGMTADEAEALFLAGLPGPAAQLGLGTVVAAAQLKVMAALPPELRSRATRIVERFHLDVAGWFQADEPVPHLATLSSAVWDGRIVAITYERGPGGVERRIGPLGLVLKGGVWYVVGAIDGQIRTYRGSRILSATVLDERVDATAGLRPRRATGPRPARPTSARPRRYRSACDCARTGSIDCGPSSATWRSRRPTHLDEPDPEGWVRLRLRLAVARGGPGAAARGRVRAGGPRPARGPRSARGDRGAGARTLPGGGPGGRRRGARTAGRCRTVGREPRAPRRRVRDGGQRTAADRRSRAGVADGRTVLAMVDVTAVTTSCDRRRRRRPASSIWRSLSAWIVRANSNVYMPRI